VTTTLNITLSFVQMSKVVMDRVFECTWYILLNEGQIAELFRIIKVLPHVPM